jgi:hypothetical protein
VSHDTGHVRDFLSGEDWLVVKIGACILKNIVGPVSQVAWWTGEASS